MMNRMSLTIEGNKPGSTARRMTHWMDHVLGPMYQKYRPAEAWKPAINLYECDSAYYMVVDLAGVKGETIDLRAENRMLILSGERATPEVAGPSQKTRVRLMEIDHGPFHRSLELPEDVDVDQIQATYRCGLLWVRMPKRS